MFNIVWTPVNSFGKDHGEHLLIQNNKQTSTYLHQKTIMATANAVDDLFVVTVSIYLHHLRYL